MVFYISSMLICMPKIKLIHPYVLIYSLFKNFADEQLHITTIEIDFVSNAEV